MKFDLYPGGNGPRYAVAAAVKNASDNEKFDSLSKTLIDSAQRSYEYTIQKVQNFTSDYSKENISEN